MKVLISGPERRCRCRCRGRGDVAPRNAAAFHRMSDPGVGHLLETERSPELSGEPTIYKYRGARVTAWKSSVKLVLAGHPYAGCTFGNLPHTLMLVDWWLDQGRLPQPYVWPAPERKKPTQP